MNFYRPKNLTSSFPLNISLSHTFYVICIYLLGAILTISGIAKLVDSTGLLTTLQQVGILGNEEIVFTVTLLPIIELGLALALFLQWQPKATLIITSFLFACFLGIATYGLVLGWSADCGCFGELTESSFGWGMVVRNGIFLSLSAAALAAYNKHLRKRG